MASTCRRANTFMISKTDCSSLVQKLFNSRSRCRILELGITSQDSCCDVAHLLFPIMGKLKPQNHAEISFTNYEFVSRNYAKQSAGYVFWAE